MAAILFAISSQTHVLHDRPIRSAANSILETNP